MPPFFEELKRRRVFRVAVVYAVVAWFVIEVADVLVPGLGLPDLMITAIIVLALLGFPVAVVLAWAFDVTPAGVKRAGAVAPADGEARETASTDKPRFGLYRAPWFILGFLVAMTGAWMIMNTGGPESSPDLDDTVVAVLPFRTTGADPQITYLREGMVDLLAATLTGEVGPRAMDSRTVLAAWRGRTTGDEADLPQSDALELAASLGAGWLLQGETVGTASNVTLTASILDVRTGAVDARARVEGSADSLPALVDRLAATLVSLGAGENQERVSALADVPLPALRHYLTAQSAYRRGHYSEAVHDFDQALQIDSTFALAALGLASTAGWSANNRLPGALRLAHASRSRLSPQDRAYLDALGGPDFPRQSSGIALIKAAERAVRVAPDRTEAWYMLGDNLFHWGAAVGIADAEERAAEAFRKALTFDSTFAPPLQHLVDLAAGMGDTATVRRLGVPYLARDTAGEMSDYLSWRVATALNDTTARRQILAQLDSRSALGLLWINGAIQNEGLAPEDAGPARRALLDRLEQEHSPQRAHFVAHTIATNGGRPAEARQHLEALGAARRPGATAPPATATDVLVVLVALYADGDTAAAREAAHRLADRATSPAEEPRDEVACTAAQWHAWRGDAEGSRRVAEWLRAAAEAKDQGPVARWCLALLDAIEATAGERPDALERVTRLDSITRTAPPLGTYGHYTNPNLGLARLLEAVGETEAALAAVRRGWRRGLPPDLFRASHLREEGRLAAMIADTAGAIRAYRRYLTLRSDPEPAIRADVDRVRDELARLVDEGAR